MSANAEREFVARFGFPETPAGDRMAAELARLIAWVERRALLDAASVLDRERVNFAAGDKSEGCESRFCDGWCDGVAFAVRQLHIRATRIEVAA